MCGGMHQSRVQAQIDKGLRHQRAGRLEQAAKSYRQVLADDPRQPEALHLMGVIAHKLGNLDDAVELIAESLRIEPANVSAMNNLAGVLQDQRRLPEALEFYDAAIQASPKAAYLHCNRGIVLKELGFFEEAITSLMHALELDPRSYAAHSNLGTVYTERGETAEAAECYRRALALNPRSYEALSNLGVVLRERGEFKEAEDCFRRAVAVNPNCDTAFTNLGATLKNLGRVEEAISSYLQALELNPRSHFALNNLGNMLKESGHFTDATTCFAQAIAARPEFHLAHNNLGSAYCELGRTHEAVDCFRRSLELKPAYHSAFSNLLFTLNYLGSTDRATLFAEHRRFDEIYGQPLRQLAVPHANSPDPVRRLRVGFVSGDFREHPVVAFIEPVFTHHNAAEVEIFCYANHQTHDAVSERLRSQVEHWRRVAGWSDDELANVIRQDGIDILVDLSGHTAHNRLLVFARKPAPVQVSMVGYMQTTGLSAMDYRITDEGLDPSGVSDPFNTETLVRLPAGAAPFQPPAECPPVNALPALENGFVTFGAFNNLAKVTAEVITTWGRLLLAMPTARLIVVGREGNPVTDRLVGMGVEAERVEFIPRQPMKEYLALHHRVDVMLDTFPYNGGTTTLIAAWMGLPFVTVASASTTGRTGEGLLRPLGLTELVASSPDDYIACAISAASDLDRLAEWRGSLRGKLAPFFANPGLFVGQLENAFRGMWQRWCASHVAPPAPVALHVAE
jgi:predicted O-linked N-acetylglucosamine transferase (SPINDLY family)